MLNLENHLSLNTILFFPPCHFNSNLVLISYYFQNPGPILHASGAECFSLTGQMNRTGLVHKPHLILHIWIGPMQPHLALACQDQTLHHPPPCARIQPYCPTLPLPSPMCQD